MSIQWQALLPRLRERIRPWYLRNVYFPVFPGRKPSYFDRAWDYPHVPLLPEGGGGIFFGTSPFLGANPAESRPGDVDSPDFLFLPLSDIHFRIQRPHFLMRALALRGHRSFFVNPHLGRQFRSRRDVSPQIARISPGVFELHIRLPLEPVYHQRLLSSEESGTIADAVVGLKSGADSGGLIQVVASPVWWRAAEMIRRRTGAPILYDCHDLIAGFSSTDRSIVEEEINLIAGSDFVVCTSAALREHCMSAGAPANRCVIVPNGVSAATEGALLLKAPVNDGRRTVGYLGALEDWFDVESIRSAASARPTWRFVLAGRIESQRLSVLRHLDNVEFRGEIQRDAIPEFLASLDVAVIPFIINNLTRAVDPIKLYEYLAAGLPVVSCRLPETLRFSDVVRHYDTPGDFITAVEAALEGGRQENLARRQAVAGETWEARAGQLLECVKLVRKGIAGEIISSDLRSS